MVTILLSVYNTLSETKSLQWTLCMKRYHETKTYFWMDNDTVAQEKKLGTFILSFQGLTALFALQQGVFCTM